MFLRGNNVLSVLLYYRKYSRILTMTHNSLKIFVFVLLLTIFFHPKPICTNLGCTSFTHAWLTLRPLWESKRIQGNTYPQLRDLPFNERYINAEVSFDLIIALIIVVLTCLVFSVLINKVKILKTSKYKTIFRILTIIILWVAFIYLFSLPYQIYSLEDSTSPFFKPIPGGIVDIFPM